MLTWHCLLECVGYDESSHTSSNYLQKPQNANFFELKHLEARIITTRVLDFYVPTNDSLLPFVENYFKEETEKNR